LFRGSLQGIDSETPRQVSPDDLGELDVELLELPLLKQPRGEEALQLLVGQLMRRNGGRGWSRRSLGSGPLAPPPEDDGRGEGGNGEEDEPRRLPRERGARQLRR